MAANVVRRRKTDKKSSTDKIKMSDLLLTKEEFGSFINLFRQPGQCAIQGKAASDVYDYCRQVICTCMIIPSVSLSLIFSPMYMYT